MTGDVGVVGLLTSLVLVAVVVVLSQWQRLGLTPSVLWASGRALVQLLLVGGALDIVIDPARPLALSWLWVALMVAFAAYTAARRAPEVPAMTSLALVAFGASAAVTLGVLFGLQVFPLEGRTLVPLTGMTIGNSMTATVLVSRRVVEELRDKRAEVEARLALGQPSTEAAPTSGPRCAPRCRPRSRRPRRWGSSSCPAP